MDFEIIRSEVKQILMTLVVNHKDKVTPSYLRLLLHCVLSDLKEIQKTKTIKKCTCRIKRDFYRSFVLIYFFSWENHWLI